MREARSAGTTPHRTAVANPAATANVEHERIDGDRVEARQVSRAERHQQPHAGAREQQADHGSGERDRQALGEHLPHQLRTAGANRRADGELAAARRGADDEQVGDVGARDQQHEGNRAHQRQDRRTHAADEVVEHRHDVEVEA